MIVLLCSIMFYTISKESISENLFLMLAISVRINNCCYVKIPLFGFFVLNPKLSDLAILCKFRL